MAKNQYQPVPLSKETRSVITTKEAAYHLNRAEQTLRLWAMYKNGPVAPVKICGRLAWPVAELKKIVGLPE